MVTGTAWLRGGFPDGESIGENHVKKILRLLPLPFGPNVEG